MAPTTAFPFDIDALLEPVSAEQPAGEDLQFSDLYDRIREAQREDDPSLNRGVWQFPLKKADWAEVERLCIETLRSKAKDLQVASTLLNAWVQRHGFEGLREGLLLMTGLVGRYAEHFFPHGADDIDYRVSPLEWLNEKVPVRLKLLPITNPTGTDTAPSTYAAFESAGHTGNKKPDDKNGFQHSALLTPTEYFAVLLRDVEGCLHALTELDRVLDEKLGQQAPSLRQLWSALEAIRNLIVEILSQRDVPAEDIAALAGPPAAAPSRIDYDDPGTPVFSSRPIRSRDEAYQVLTEAAEYLARTEPHSPTPYLVRRAVTWGMMSLEELLPELVRNGAELQEVFRLLQMQLPKK